MYKHSLSVQHKKPFENKAQMEERKEVLLLWWGHNNSAFFFLCQITRLVWQVNFVPFLFPPCLSIPYLIGKWLLGLNISQLAQILVGGCAICWSIWNRQNRIAPTNRSFLKIAGSFIWQPIGSIIGPDYSVLRCRTLATVLQPLGDSHSRFIQPVRTECQ
jgi:hypothetical protein